jgi:hypothetical protein
MNNKNAKQLPETHKKTMTEEIREAEERPLEFDPNIRARYIRQMLQDIQTWASQGDSDETIRERVPDFIEKYPELYKKIINKNDLTPIQSMLQMLDKMGDGSISQHKASVVIGKKLVDRYITPQLSNSSKSK